MIPLHTLSIARSAIAAFAAMGLLWGTFAAAMPDLKAMLGVDERELGLLVFCTPLAAIIPRYTWIAKSELRRIPLFGRAAEAAGIVFIDRDNRKAAFESYKLAAKDVQRGRSVIICPEDTRGKD